MKSASSFPEKIKMDFWDFILVSSISKPATVVLISVGFLSPPVSSLDYKFYINQDLALHHSSPLTGEGKLKLNLSFLLIFSLFSLPGNHSLSCLNWGHLNSHNETIT